MPSIVSVCFSIFIQELRVYVINCSSCRRVHFLMPSIVSVCFSIFYSRIKSGGLQNSGDAKSIFIFYIFFLVLLSLVQNLPTSFCKLHVYEVHFFFLDWLIEDVLPFFSVCIW
jgi:hypothetical protein